MQNRYALFIASIAAAAIHFAVVAPHLDEWIPAAVFMLVVGLGQFAWAFAARNGKLLSAGALANGATAALWLMSRTSGIPIGPMRWQPESMGAADVTATLLELLIVAMILARDSRAQHELSRLALITAAVAVFAGDSRQRLIIAATFILAVLIRTIVTLAPFELAVPWRSHEEVTHPRRLFVHVGDPARAGVGARR